MLCYVAKYTVANIATYIPCSLIKFVFYNSIYVDALRMWHKY